MQYVCRPELDSGNIRSSSWISLRANCPALAVFRHLLSLFFCLALSTLVFCLADANLASAAQTTRVMPFQGFVTDVDGNPLNETAAFHFAIYDAPFAGVKLWEESWDQ